MNSLKLLSAALPRASHVAVSLTRLTLCVSALSAFNLSPASAADTHLFILSGQSNMAGLKHENSFLPELKKLLPAGTEILDIKVARGGQPIRKWIPEWDDIAKKHGLDPIGDAPVFYEPILAAYRKLIDDGKKPKTLTFFWMQGEKDAKSSLDAAYKDSLKQLIDNLRRDLDAPDMAFVIGRISDHEPGEAHQANWEAVRKAQVDIANEDPLGAWVDTDDCNNKIKKDQPTNDLHYTQEGYDLFGQRLARQAVLLIRGEKPAADGRPQ